MNKSTSQSGSQALRMTRQRRAILEAFRRSPWHPTTDEVFRRVRRRLPRMSLATVYRNLNVLSSAGLISAVDVSGAPRRFDAELRQHYHIRCLGCGRVDDAPMAPLRRFRNGVWPESGYEVVAHRLEFMGYCPACRKRRRTRKRT